MANLKPEIKIYTTKTCHYCIEAKKYFKSKKIAFKEIDVDSREKVKEMINISGQSGVPVIVIGKNVVVGFDKHAIEKILKTG
ncbi:MAG TPA: glutaredoxin family protein [Candidatus Nanoarchaeia archaeon]|nr:glutaredoxin family protein [Candidatus Nanoarchaeia archaeon]